MSKHTVLFDDSTIGICILRFREDGFVLLGKWFARHVLSSSELSWSCTGCATITWTKELTFAALDPELLRHVLLFAGRTSAGNLAMACTCAFGAGLMPRPTSVPDFFDADASAAYFDAAWGPLGRIEEGGLTASTCSDQYLNEASPQTILWMMRHAKSAQDFVPRGVSRCRAVGRCLISKGLHCWSFRVHGISHLRFGVLRMPEEHEQQPAFIDGPESTAWLLPYVQYPDDRCEKDLSLVLDMDERDLRLFGLFGDCRKPRFFHSVANLPCGSYKLVVEFVPCVFSASPGQLACSGYVKLLGKDPSPDCR